MRNSDERKNPFEKSHDRQIGGDLHDRILTWLYESLDWDTDSIETITGWPSDKILKIKKEIETPFYKSSYSGKSVIGFADLKVSVLVKIAYTPSDYKELEKFYTPEEAKGVIKEMKKEKFRTEWIQGYVEIKSSVNLGETIRQIKYYDQSNSGRQRWTVCAPRFPGVQILEEQGIGFIEYEED